MKIVYCTETVHTFDSNDNQDSIGRDCNKRSTNFNSKGSENNFTPIKITNFSLQFKKPNLKNGEHDYKCEWDDCFMTSRCVALSKADYSL